MNLMIKLSILISVFFTGEILLILFSNLFQCNLEILANGACPSIEECNKCSFLHTQCQMNCKYSFILILNFKLKHLTILAIKGTNCYLNAHISIFFQEINKCPFEHCYECLVDQYGCKTMCKYNKKRNFNLLCIF